MFSLRFLALISLFTLSSTFSKLPASSTTYLLLCCHIPSTIPVVSIAFGHYVSTLTAGVDADSIALLPGGSTAYIANAALETVSVIDTRTSKHEALIALPLPPGTSALQAAASPDGKHVYITANFANPSSIFVIDTSTNTVSATINLGQGTTDNIGAVVSPDGKYLYVINQLNLQVNRYLHLQSGQHHHDRTVRDRLSRYLYRTGSCSGRER